MKKSFIFVFPFILSSVVTYAGDLTPPGEGWVEKSKEKEFKTYSRKVKGSDTREVIMIGVLEAAPARCFAVVGDYECFPDFMPYIEFAKILNSKKVDDNKTIDHAFFYLSPPLVSSRFYTLELTNEKNSDGQAGAYKSSWSLDDGKGMVSYRKTPEDPSLGKKLKPAVETAFNKGYWRFDPLDGGKKTKVTYYIWTNPGGSIPSWIANKGNTVALPNLWEAVKNRLKDTKYDKAG